MSADRWYEKYLEKCEEIEMYEGMKEGVATRIADLENERDQLKQIVNDYETGIKHSTNRLTAIANKLGLTGTMFKEYGYMQVQSKIEKLRTACELAIESLTAATWYKGADQRDLKYAIDKIREALKQETN